GAGSLSGDFPCHDDSSPQPRHARLILPSAGVRNALRTLGSFPEQRGADADVSRAEHDRRLEVAAHPHRATLEPVVACELVEQGEERRRLDPERRHAHQPGERDPGAAGLGEQHGQLADRHAAFLRFFADVDLYEAGHAPPALVHRLGQRGNEARPVERMDRVEQRDSLIRLVRLQLADEVQLDNRKALAQRRPLGLRFLHPVLAEHTLAGLDQRDDRLGGMGLADGDQRDLVALAPRDAAGAGDPLVDRLKQGGCAFHARRYSEGMRARQSRTRPLPELWLVSDARNDAVLEAVLRRLPRGSGFVYRHYHLPDAERIARWHTLRRIARARGHLAILADSALTAREWGADGLYGAPRALYPTSRLVTLATAHSLRELG